MSRVFDAENVSTRVYLDYASTSPLRRSARFALADAVALDWADPSRQYTEAAESRAHLEDARARVAARCGCRPRSVVFTSGGTESIATAAHHGRTRGAHQVCSAVDHSAVAGWTKQGPHTVVAVDRHGRINPADLAAAIGPDTGLVHLQWVNHETGVVQPIEELIAIARAAGVMTHVDATQAVGRVPLDLDTLGADMVSVSGHKIGSGPGIGALLVRRGLRIEPLMFGGDQELMRRGGIENVIGAISFAAAIEEATADLEDETERVRALMVPLERWARTTDGVTIVGGEDRVPHIAAFIVEGVEPQGLLIDLDRHGVSIHAGSACASADMEPSPIIAAMGLDAHHALRISAGWATTATDIELAIAELDRSLAYLRGLGGHDASS